MLYFGFGSEDVHMILDAPDKEAVAAAALTAGATGITTNIRTSLLLLPEGIGQASQRGRQLPTSWPVGMDNRKDTGRPLRSLGAFPFLTATARTGFAVPVLVPYDVFRERSWVK